MSSTISKIEAEEIKDSRGNPTVRVAVWTGDESASFAVPSGASTGAHEAHELRDDDGKGVKRAIGKINEIIAPAMIGRKIEDQKEIDGIMIELDGTANKDNLGGNAMIGVSVACAKTAAWARGAEVFEYLRTLADIKPSRETPYLFINLINGGKHAKNNLAFQEYLVVPITDDAEEAVNIGINAQNSLREIIRAELGEASLILGDEGGLAPKIDDVKRPLLFLREAARRSGLERKTRFALDIAASSFYENGLYKTADGKLTREELMNIYNSLIREFNPLSIEDPFQEEDFEGFGKLREDNPELFTVGDDLTVTNPARLAKAIESRSINAMIIKPNQIGTLTETLETMKLARENGIELIVSHRSGETNDDFIADLAYAFGCFGLKAGSPLKAERMVKYKRLIWLSKLSRTK